MKNLLYYLLFSFAVANGQQPEFKNQSEQEIYWAKELFEKKYARQEYDKFEGKISIIDKNTILFDNKTLIGDFTPEHLSILTEGLFYPQLMLGNGANNPVKTNSQLELMTDQEKFSYVMSRNDSLHIAGFQELKELQPSRQIKRFRFLYGRKGFYNPQVYFIELTNENAKKETSAEDFIKGSKLTFLKDGWIMM